MKNKFNDAPLFLLVEARPSESKDETLGFLQRYYDQRNEEDEFGLLYEIGAQYRVDECIYYQILTFAGSLASRLLIECKAGTFPRKVAISFENEEWILAIPNQADTVSIEPPKEI